MNYKLLYAILIALISFTACNDDKDDDGDTNKIDTSSNNFVYDGEKYELSDGVIEYYGSFEDYPDEYNYDITLFTSGITYEVDSWLLGEGSFLWIVLYTKNATELDAGTYTFWDTSPEGATQTFEGEFCIDYISENYDGESVFDFGGGTVVLEKTGDEYIITLSGNNYAGKKITGYFKGHLHFYDFSEDSSKKSLKKKRQK